MAKKRKHRHQSYPPHAAGASRKPKRSAAIILAIIAAIMGLSLAWLMADPHDFNLIWLPAGAVFGAVIGYLVGHAIDKNLSEK